MLTSYLKDSFARYKIIWCFLSQDLHQLTAFWFPWFCLRHQLLILLRIPCMLRDIIFVAAFKILHLSLAFDNHIVCLIIGSNLLGVHGVSWIYRFMSFTSNLVRFSHYFSKYSFSLPSPSGTTILQMLFLMISHRSFRLYSFFLILFSFSSLCPISRFTYYFLSTLSDVATL